MKKKNKNTTKSSNQKIGKENKGKNEKKEKKEKIINIEDNLILHYFLKHNKVICFENNNEIKKNQEKIRLLKLHYKFKKENFLYNPNSLKIITTKVNSMNNYLKESIEMLCFYKSQSFFLIFKMMKPPTSSTFLTLKMKL
jgi:hypothetical protein